MIRKDNISIVEYKTLRSNPSMRLLLDLGEVDSDIVKQLHEYRMHEDQGLSIILCKTSDLKEVVDNLYDEEPGDNHEDYVDDPGDPGEVFDDFDEFDELED